MLVGELEHLLVYWKEIRLEKLLVERKEIWRENWKVFWWGMMMEGGSGIWKEILLGREKVILRVILLVVQMGWGLGAVLATLKEL